MRAATQSTAGRTVSRLRSERTKNTHIHASAQSAPHISTTLETWRGGGVNSKAQRVTLKTSTHTTRHVAGGWDRTPQACTTPHTDRRSSVRPLPSCPYPMGTTSQPTPHIGTSQGLSSNCMQRCTQVEHTCDMSHGIWLAAHHRLTGRSATPQTDSTDTTDRSPTPCQPLALTPTLHATSHHYSRAKPVSSAGPKNSGPAMAMSDALVATTLRGRGREGRPVLRHTLMKECSTITRGPCRGRVGWLVGRLVGWGVG